MMKRVFFLLAITLCFLKITIAQTGTITGVVKDSLTGVFLESATVSIFGKDSSLINYQLSDGYGAFQLNKLPLKKQVLLNVTYVGFKGFNKTVRIDSAMLNMTILLAPSFNDSSVVVTAHVPIRMNGDTLEINPAAFKMDPNAVVEDLLTQVPGVTVWADGSITMNGRKIPSVLVDGKPFMGSNDARLATQNLPKNAIDKIQVYQEVDRSLKPDERKQKDSLLTMNIKLKEDKKAGYFGKAGIGYGTTDRFESDLSFQMYNKKTSFGIGGGFNNINKSVKNLQEMFQNNTYRNYNPNLYNVGSFDKDGINKYHSIGAAFTHNFIETTNSRQNDRITINYTKSGSEQFLTDLSIQNRTTQDNPQFVENNSASNNTNSSNDIGINYIKTNSYYDEFRINGSATFANNSGNSKSTTDIEDLSGSPISNNEVNNRENSRSNDQSLSVDYRSYSQENPLQQFSVNLSVNNNNSSSNRYVNSVFKSYIKSEDDTAYNRNYNNNNANLNLSGNISYEGLKRLLLGRYNLFGISLSFDQWFNYNKSDNKQNVLDFDSISGNYITNTRLTNTNLNEKIEYTPSLRFGKSFFKWKDTYYYNIYSNFSILEDLKQDRNTSSIDIRNLSRSFAFFRYEGSLGYYYQKREKLSYNFGTSYRKNYRYPDIDQLYTITDGVDVFNVRIGNPNLKNPVNHTYSIYGNFNTQKPKSKYALNGSMNGSFLKSLNPVTDSVINDSSGKRSYYYINAPESQSYNLNYNLNLTRNLKKSNIQLMYNGSFRNGMRPNYIDNIYSQTNTIGINNSINLQFALRSMIIFKIGKTFNNNKSDQSATGLTSFKNFTDISRFGLTVNLPKSYTVSTTFNHTKNSNLDKPIMLWNAFATCRFLKNQQAEVKFSAMDILKQFQNISNSADQFGTTTRITNGLQQYFMLTFSYYPRKFGKAEVKKRVVEQAW